MPASHYDDSTPIPSIAIISDSTHNVLDVEERDPNTDHALLSSLDVPPSPTSTEISREGSSITAPSSPTFSTASSFVHFTSMALRDKKSEERSHSRRPSNATFNSESTHPGQQFLSSHGTDLAQKTMNSDATPVVDDREGQSRGKLKEWKKLSNEGKKSQQMAHQTELAQDRDTDTTPFKPKPFKLARMVDPKSTEVLDCIRRKKLRASVLTVRVFRYTIYNYRQRERTRRIKREQGAKVQKEGAPRCQTSLFNFGPAGVEKGVLHLHAVHTPQLGRHSFRRSCKQSNADVFWGKGILSKFKTSQGGQTINPSTSITGQGDNISNAVNKASKKLSPGLRPAHTKREPIIDEVTQVIDLTSEINITDSNPVSYGGFSFIYKGEWEQNHDASILSSASRNTATKTEVAVKLLRVFPRQTRNVDLAVRARKRLNREVNVWKRLDHPNIARFYGVSFQFDGRPALVMQWYPNETAPVFTKTLSKEDKLTFIKEISRGLSYLHALKPPVVHGDLKGTNVLVDKDGHAIITDFGLAKVLEEFGEPTGNTTTTVAGSVYWQAPELLSGDDDDEAVDEDNSPSSPSTPTLSSDVWAFGCTVYELVTGNRPYYYRTRDLKAMADIISGIRPLRSNDVIIHESKALLDILNDCWKMTPSDRPRMKDINLRLEAMNSA